MTWEHKSRQTLVKVCALSSRSRRGPLHREGHAEVLIQRWAELTGAGLDAGGAEAELLVLVGYGLVGGRHVGGRGRAVLLTHAVVVKVTTRLRRDTWSWSGLLDFFFSKKGGEPRFCTVWEVQVQSDVFNVSG